MSLPLCLRHWREFAICPRVLPEPERDWNRIDVEPTPPCNLVTGVMQLAMVGPADRHNELVTDSAPERARLGEGQVMRIGWHTAAYEAGLPQHEFPVVLIAQPNRFAQSIDRCFLARLEALSLAPASGPATVTAPCSSGA